MKTSVYNITFNKQSYVHVANETGLQFVNASIEIVGRTEPTDVRFLLDTGAYLTLLTRETAGFVGCNMKNSKEFKIWGFGGPAITDSGVLSGLKFGNRLFTNLPVLVFKDKYRYDKENKEIRPNYNILGQNLLTYFNYYIDNLTNRFYFKDNPKPYVYNSVAKPSGIFSMGPDTVVPKLKVFSEL